MLKTRQQAGDMASNPRARILDASYELFSQRGIRAVGVNEVIERADVATATLYRHFPSKDELVLAFLELREQRWTKGLVEAGAIRRGSNPSSDCSPSSMSSTSGSSATTSRRARSSTYCSSSDLNTPPAAPAFG